MKLEEFLKIANLSQAQFAIKSKISRMALYRYLKGKKPSPEAALRIHQATRGKVSLKDLGF